jgi:hypothetical protein
MRIDWGIRKSQGNSRPVFWYEIRLTPEEESLNPRVDPVQTDVPVPLAMFVNGGKAEEPASEMLRPTHLDQRDDLPKLLIYGDRGRRWVVLPFRPDGAAFLPEVRKAVDALRLAFELALMNAVAEDGFEMAGSMEMSDEAKARLAAYIAKKKIFPF